MYKCTNADHYLQNKLMKNDLYILTCNLQYHTSHKKLHISRTVKTSNLYARITSANLFSFPLTSLPFHEAILRSWHMSTNRYSFTKHLNKFIKGTVGKY